MHKQRFDHHSTNPDVEADIPTEVAQYLVALKDALVSKDVPTAHGLYEVKFPQLTKQFYTAAPHHGHPRGPKVATWPKLAFTKRYIQHPQVEMLYHLTQLRSAYAGHPAAFIRVETWNRYHEAFDLLLDPSFDLGVPLGWVWDVVDEYIYLVETHKTKSLRPTETMSPHVGSVNLALARLEDVVKRSNIVAELAAAQKAGTASSSFLDSRAPGNAQVKTTLGLCALIGVVRLRTILADYVGALDATAALGLTTGDQITMRIPPAHASLFYHAGFCYLMCRRYVDATNTLKKALMVKSLERVYLERLQSQVVSLLAIACTLGGTSMFDYASYISERNNYHLEDDVALLSQGDLDRFREVFLRCAPRFVSALDTVPPVGTPPYEQVGQEARELQLRAFLREVQQQHNAFQVRSYLGAYSTVPVAKISELFRRSEGGASSTTAAVADPTDAFSFLVSVKHKARQLQVTPATAANPLAGVFAISSDIDFTVADGQVNVTKKQDATSVAVKLFDRIQAIPVIAA